MTKTILAIAAALTISAAGTAFAADKCKVAKEEWQPETILKTKLEAEGWKIARIKHDAGCYEVYGTDGSGKKAETYFDPKTLAPVS